MSIFLQVDVKRHTDHRNGRYKHKGEIWSNTPIVNGFENQAWWTSFIVRVMPLMYSTSDTNGEIHGLTKSLTTPEITWLANAFATTGNKSLDPFLVSSSESAYISSASTAVAYRNKLESKTCPSDNLELLLAPHISDQACWCIRAK